MVEVFSRVLLGEIRKFCGLQFFILTSWRKNVMVVYVEDFKYFPKNYFIYVTNTFSTLII